MYAINYAKYLGIPISRVRCLLPEAGECGAEATNISKNSLQLHADECSLLPSQALTSQARHGRPSCAFWSWRIQVWITLRDIERLGLDRVAREAKVALAVPDIQMPLPRHL